MDNRGLPRKHQTSTASPAELGELPLSLGEQERGIQRLGEAVAALMLILHVHHRNQHRYCLRKRFLSVC